MSLVKDSDSSDRIKALAQALRFGPRSAKELMNVLGVSQPTLSRTIQFLPDVFSTFRVSGDRTPKYATLRALPCGLNPRQRISRISSTGAIEHFAEVEFLAGGATLERAPHKTTLYEGLPPYMVFSSPSGFLGREVARSAAALDAQFPESLKDWGDEHRVAHLFTRGLNLAGNLVYGMASLQREMDFRKVAPAPVDQTLDHYVAIATQLKDSAHGSSAGGEQPKFLSHSEDAGHVIVKFAKRGARMAELLPLEHEALRALESVGVPSAKTRLLASNEYVFLEAQRFDRIGAHGRVGMLSAGAIDDEFFGARDTWSEFAARCVQAKYLSAGDARHVDVMAAFSELIGNTDRHFENISVLLGDDGEYSGIAPPYDILPKRYASIGGGVDPDLTPIVPKLSTVGAQPDVWAAAADAAERFWDAVRQDRLALPVPPAFQQLAVDNLVVVREFVAPLLPSAARGA